MADKNANLSVEQLAALVARLTPEDRKALSSDPRVNNRPASSQAVPPGARKGTDADGKCIRCGRGFVDKAGNRSWVWERGTLRLSVDCVKAHDAACRDGHPEIVGTKYSVPAVSGAEFKAMSDSDRGVYLRDAYRLKMQATQIAIHTRI